MTIKIYKNDYSPPSRAALITAELLKIDYTAVNVDLTVGEHFTPQYLEKNPMHSVPVLEDGDFILADSHAIMPYLISKYGTAEQRDKWYPSDLKLRATIDQRLFFECSLLAGTSRLIVMDLLAGKKAPTEKQIEYANDAYGILEKYLQKTRYVAADHFTIADVSIVLGISSYNVFVPVDAKYTRIHEWWNLLKEEDWYKKINVPGLTQYEVFIKILKEKAK